MSSEAKTLTLNVESQRASGIPVVYDAKVARLRHIAASELDEDGPLWSLTEGRFPDAVNLPGRRYAHLWRLVESPVEAFHCLAPRLLEEVAMLGFGLSIMETIGEMWLCTLVAEEKVRK